jgi:rfaE bifunctional protein nucleotidyltransferase chain/domain
METLSTEIEATLQAWREQGESIVFTNGVFDILHAGHVTYLKGARELGSRLIVGVNADASVRMLGKGPNRPINDEASRKLVLEALRSVDVAVVFSSQTPMDLIAQIRPNVLVKGGDYDPQVESENDKRYIVGSREVLEYGGKVTVIPFLEGHSTTAIIEKSRSKG